MYISGAIPQERVLWINWNVEGDKLGFQLQLPEKPFTRRGLLSMLSSVYDPLGLAGPLNLWGRSIIQTLCKDNFGWDKRIPWNIERQWAKWIHRLQGLVSINIPRCYKPQKLGNIERFQHTSLFWCQWKRIQPIQLFVACRHKWEHPLYHNSW